MTAAAAEPDPRITEMAQNPAGYFIKARRLAREEAQAATERERELRGRRDDD